MMRCPTTLLMVSIVALSACSSHLSAIWEDDVDPPQLKDGTITLKTTWKANSEEGDIRRVKCRDGKIVVELISRSQGHRVGVIPTRDWESIWDFMLQSRPFSDAARFDLEQDDPRASGPYHVITLQLGSQFHQFSAQYRMNILGVFKTSAISDRLRHSDVVAELVSQYATQELAPPEKPKPTEKKKSGGG